MFVSQPKSARFGRKDVLSRVDIALFSLRIYQHTPMFLLPRKRSWRSSQNEATVFDIQGITSQIKTSFSHEKSNLTPSTVVPRRPAVKY